MVSGPSRKREPAMEASLLQEGRTLIEQVCIRDQGKEGWAVSKDRLAGRWRQAPHLAVDAILRVDDEPLPLGLLLLPLRIHILIDRRRTDPSKQARVLLDVGLDVRGARRGLDVQVHGLVFGVVGVGAADAFEDVLRGRGGSAARKRWMWKAGPAHEGEFAVRLGVVDLLELPVAGSRSMDQLTASGQKDPSTSRTHLAGRVAA